MKIAAAALAEHPRVNAGWSDGAVVRSGRIDAVVNAPQAAILAVGRIADRVVAVDGAPAVRPTLVLTLSLDHRAIDGAIGARFLDTPASLVEEPAGLVS